MKSNWNIVKVKIILKAVAVWNALTVAAWFGLCENENLKVKLLERWIVKVVEEKIVKVKVVKGVSVIVEMVKAVSVIVEMVNVKGWN